MKSLDIGILRNNIVLRIHDFKNPHHIEYVPIPTEKALLLADALLDCVHLLSSECPNQTPINSVNNWLIDHC